MAIIKCKMCGGDMELTADQRCGTCEYCGSTMTLPKVDDEQRAAAFNRGNHFRRIGEFDKALTVYERIVQEDESDAEAHWCCALCRFGIEYVKDPASGEYLPTCHRASFDSFLKDVDYQAALQYADVVARRQYEQDGEKIAQVQRGILSVSQKEQPFDVFICYKESDDRGNRTVDSTLAQDIYYQLTDAGYRVFFSRITLEDKAGQAYEPYIFAALHSAKVMIVVGTRPEYLNAVWVKNEWSRYLAIVKNDRKKLLIPCYRDMDPYDMPEQLSVLQSYDMGKIGFVQDLIRGISKVIVKESHVQETARENVAAQSESNSSLTALLKRGYMALEDQEWARADEFFEQVLNLDAECGEAFFGKYLVEQRLSSMDALIKQECNVKFSTQTIGILKDETQERRKAIGEYSVPGYLESLKIGEIIDAFTAEYQSQVADIQNKLEQEKRKLSKETENRLLARAFRYASGKFAFELNSARAQILESLEQELKEARQADRREEQRLRADFDNHKQQSLEAIRKLHKEAIEKREGDYQKAVSLQKRKKYGAAETKFYCVGDYKDVKERMEQCQKSAGKRMKKIIAAMIAIIVMTTVSAYVYQNIIVPSGQYRQADALLAERDYDGAAAAFAELGEYKDAAERVLDTKYTKAEDLLEQKDYHRAVIAFMEVDGYQDARERGMEIWNQIAVRSSIAAGGSHTIGLKFDGSVVAVGNNMSRQCNVSEWQDIVAVAARSSHTIGLKSDGSVVAVGNNMSRQCNVSEWQDIVAVTAGGSHTIGLKSRGTLVTAGSNLSGQCDVSDWQDIVAVAAGDTHTVGLKSDRTVVAVGSNARGQCDVSDWQDIVAIAAGDAHTIGLKSDGTVVAVGSNVSGQCNVSGWQDIVVIAAGEFHTVGLKSDGTVVAVGSNVSGQCNVSGWQDIVAIAAGEFYTVGLKSDGTVVTAGDNRSGQCNVSDWTDIRLPERN